MVLEWTQSSYQEDCRFPTLLEPRRVSAPSYQSGTASTRRLQVRQVLIQVLWPLQQPSFDDSNTFYLYKAFYKKRRQVKLQESFDKLKSSSYYKKLQESFIIIYSKR